MAWNTATLKDRWANLSPRARSTISIIGLGLVLLGFSSLIVNDGGKSAIAKRPKDPSTTNLILPSRKDVTVEGLAGGLDATNSQVAKLAEELKRSNEQNMTLIKRLQETPGVTQNNASADLAREVMALRQQVETMGNKKPAGEPKGASPGLHDSLPSPNPNAAVQPETPSSPPADESPKLRVIGERKAVEKKEKAEKTKNTGQNAYLAAGSMFEGVLINGMDAPTSNVTQKNPVPALIRIKTDATMPNLYKLDIKECFGLVSGHGVLATERAQLRTETLSCVRKDGSVIEAKMEGYVVGEDGKVGLRGRLVSKQGNLIAKSLLAGVLSGFGQAIAPTAVPQLNVSPGSTAQYQMPDMGAVAESAVARGFSTSAKEVSKLYLEMAHEMFPVVEVDAMRRVTIILIRGIELSGGNK